MRSDGWHITDDIDEFLAQAGGFLRSQPARHTTPLTGLEKLRTQRDTDTVFGWLDQDGEVRAIFYRRSSRRLTVTALPAEQTDVLADRLTGLGLSFAGVTAEDDTAAAFSEAWQRNTGVTSVPGVRVRLYRLGTLTPPEPFPAGRGRVAEAQDHEQVVRWCDAFRADVDEAPAESWAVSRFADKQFTFWETPDGTPVSIAGSTPMVGGMVRVDPVYTPAHLRGRGYAGAVTVEVSRAALAAGATDVVLFTNPANATSNALYQRIGYVPVTYFTGYDFS